MERKILIIEDEKAIADILAFNLQREGYQTREEHDGVTGLEQALSGGYDLILLDVMLPGIDGFEICRQVRQRNDVPIIMLTAREEETDKVFGLELGADDYITKPFSMRELMARIKANMRRLPSVTGGEKSNISVLDSEITIDNDKGEILKSGRQIPLTMREFELVKCMSARPGHVFSREELMEKVWGYEYYGDLRAVDVAIRRLREKIEDNPAEPTHIMTKRGAGYYYARVN